MWYGELKAEKSHGTGGRSGGGQEADLVIEGEVPGRKGG